MVFIMNLIYIEDNTVVPITTKRYKIAFNFEMGWGVQVIVILSTYKMEHGESMFKWRRVVHRVQLYDP